MISVRRMTPSVVIHSISDTHKAQPEVFALPGA